jgi:hypothetical protein
MQSAIPNFPTIAKPVEIRDKFIAVPLIVKTNNG